MLRAVISSALVACGTPAQRALERVEPPRASAGQSTSAVVVGYGLDAVARVDLDTTAPITFDRGWRVWVGERAIDQVTWRDRGHLDIVVPSGVPVGTHDVIAIAPDGDHLVLENGFTVIASGADVAGTELVVTAPRPARLVSRVVVPAAVMRTHTFAVTLEVTNVGGAAATGVTAALNVTGSGVATELVPPTGAGVTVLPGATATLAWTFRADATGALDLSSTASGVDDVTGQPIAGPASAVAQIVEQIAIADPFGDGTAVGNITGYAGQVVVGPNRTGTIAIRLTPGGAPAGSYSFAFAPDTVGTKTRSNAITYASFGAMGCTPDTPACGPDNENGRGVLATVALGGEWLLGGGPSAAFLHFYMTADTDDLLDFRYVDASGLLGAGNVPAMTAAGSVAGRAYVGLASTGGQRPALLALPVAPPAPGLEGMLIDLRVDAIPGLRSQVNTVDMIDVVAEHAGRLVVANKNAWVRATTATPRPAHQESGDWVAMHPAAHPAYSFRTSRATTKVGDLEPADRAVPQIASFGGRLFVGRNTTAGPQLWSCDPAREDDPAHCDSDEWTLVAPNTTGDMLLTQFDDPALTAIAMVVATPTHLYVGFDSSAGARVYRTANPMASSRADFTGDNECTAGPSCAGRGGNGLGDPANRRIFDGKALTFAGASTVWCTLGDGSAPLVLGTVP